MTLCTFVWKRHQLAHTAVENMLYTPILARASSSESSTLSSFVTKLAEKRFWYDGLLNTAHYTILARPFRSESSTITFFSHKYSKRTYGQLCSQCTEKTPTGLDWIVCKLREEWAEGGGTMGHIVA